MLRQSQFINIFDGWQEDISNARTFDDLPVTVKSMYVSSKNTQVQKFCLVSVGPDRNANIVLRDILNNY